MTGTCQNSIHYLSVGKGKNIRQLCIESFYQEVNLKRTKTMINICRSTQALWSFFFQIVRQFNHRHITAYILHVQIFVEGLRSTETGWVTETKIDILSRIITQIGTRTEYHMVNQIMLVQTTANKESPVLILPFILKKGTTDIHFLVYRTIISPHIIFQFILIEFYSGSQVGRHEDTFCETINILRSCHPV